LPYGGFDVVPRLRPVRLYRRAELWYSCSKESPLYCTALHCAVAGLATACCSAQHQAENKRRRDARAAAREQRRQEAANATSLVAAAALARQRDALFAAGGKCLTPSLLRSGEACAAAAQYPSPRAPPSIYVAPQAGPLPTPNTHARTLSGGQTQQAADSEPPPTSVEVKLAARPEPEPEAEPEPEPEAEPYRSEAQVAGHPGGIRFEGKLLLKRLQGAGKHDAATSLSARRDAIPSRGDKEAKFLLHTAPAHSFLCDRVPLAHEIRTNPDGSRWIVMDNLTAGFTTPAILDIKMGTLTYGPAGAHTFN
jgi:hypothetical protein